MVRFMDKVSVHDRVKFMVRVMVMVKFMVRVMVTVMVIVRVMVRVMVMVMVMEGGRGSSMKIPISNEGTT